MLKRLLSTTVTIAFLISGATVALEALGVLFQASSADSDSERQRMEAFIARIEARFDPASPVEPAAPVDLPSTPEAEQLRRAAAGGALKVAPAAAHEADEAPLARDAVQAPVPQEPGRRVADIQPPALQPERERPILAAGDKGAPRPGTAAAAPAEPDRKSGTRPEPESEPAPEDAEPNAKAKATLGPASPAESEPAPAKRIAAAAPAPAASRRTQGCTTGDCARPVSAHRSRRSARRVRRRPRRAAGIVHCPLLRWLQ